MSGLPTVRPNTFIKSHAPGADTQATVTQAAVVGRRHVITTIIASITTNGTAQIPININLVIGSTTYTIATAAGPTESQSGVAISGCWKGGENQAVTLEFADAGVADSVEVVHMTGYTEPA